MCIIYTTKTRNMLVCRVTAKTPASVSILHGKKWDTMSGELSFDLIFHPVAFNPHWLYIMLSVFCHKCENYDRTSSE